jgi:hypothetical protein
MTELKPLPHELKTFEQIVEYEGTTYLISSVVNFIKTPNGCKPHVEICSIDEVYIEYMGSQT